MSQPTSPKIINCNGCTECCRGPRKLSISESDAQRLKHYRVFNNEGMTYYLARKENEDCYYLGDSGCSIYDTRPDKCRVFDCRDHIEKADLPERILIQARLRC